MRNQFTETVERYRAEEKRARNEQLRLRLSRDKTFEEMLAELSCLKGLNKEERVLSLP